MLNKFDGIIDLLRNDGSIIINKNLAFRIGLETATVYIELLSKYRWFKNEDMLTKDGYFYNTIDNFRLDTTITGKRQRKAIEELERLNLIKTDLRGLPPKRHFKPVSETDYIISLINEGAKQREELKEKLAEKADVSKKRYFGGINSSDKAKTNIPNKSVNNTKGTILSNKKPNSDDGAFNKQANKVVFDIWEYYKLAVEDYFQPRKLTSKRRGKIRDMLEDFSVNEIKQAIDNIAANNFMTGQVDGNFKATIMYLFQFENMEKWIANCKVDNQMEEIDYYADLS